MYGNVVFLGGMFPKEDEKEVFSNSIGHTQAAANELQWKLINGLEKNIQKSVQLFTGLFIGSFPKNYRKCIIRRKQFSHDGVSSDIQVGFVNLAILKHFFYYKAYKREINKARPIFENTMVIIGYSANMSHLLIHIKRKYPHVKTLLVLPDLPIYTSLGSKNTLLNMYKRYSNVRFLRDVQSGMIDNYVFLTDQMGKYLNVEKEKYVVIEGIAERVDSSYTYENDKSEKVILYTGTLAKQYGVMDLIDEFLLLDGEYHLIICGGGDNYSIVQERCMCSDRITFKGLVSHEEVLSLQKKADVLVNPRKNNDQFTKYSFPSKLLEYLSTGHPTVCYKLDGIPDEYDDVFFYASPEFGGLAQAIKNAANLCTQERQEYISKVKALLNDKTDESQCSKIVALMNKRN